MLKNYLITYLTSCENLKLIKVGVSNPDLAMLFIPLCDHRIIAEKRIKGGDDIGGECSSALSSLVAVPPTAGKQIPFTRLQWGFRYSKARLFNAIFYRRIITCTRILTSMEQSKIFISSHFVYTDRHLDIKIHWGVPEFWYLLMVTVPCSSKCVYT